MVEYTSSSMHSFSRRRAIGALFVSSTMIACKSRASSAQRCALWVMSVAPDSRFRAGATKDGRALSFDAPRCLFQYRSTAAGRGLSDPWVIEHYGPGELRTPARAVRYVRASDVRGPMGPDLVPVAPGSVDRFRRDHGGLPALEFDAVTDEIVRGL